MNDEIDLITTIKEMRKIQDKAKHEEATIINFALKYLIKYQELIKVEKPKWDYEYLSETVNHPKHYNTGKYEVIDVIEDWKLGFNLGNSIKYIARCEHKHDDKKEDIKKAIWYLERELKK